MVSLPSHIRSHIVDLWPYSKADFFFFFFNFFFKESLDSVDLNKYMHNILIVGLIP